MDPGLLALPDLFALVTSATQGGSTARRAHLYFDVREAGRDGARFVRARSAEESDRSFVVVPLEGPFPS